MEINPTIDPAPQPSYSEVSRDPLPPVTPAAPAPTPESPVSSEHKPLDDGLGVVVDLLG